MEQNSNTEKTEGILDKNVDYKSKRKRTPSDNRHKSPPKKVGPKPFCGLGDKIVVKRNKYPNAVLVKIIGFNPLSSHSDRLTYYGLIIGVQKHPENIGQIIHFEEKNSWYSSDFYFANVSPESYIWIKEINKLQLND